MSVVINQEKCIGCKRCVEVCPGNLLKMDETGRAYIRHPKDCWGCTSCIKECNKSAIAFFLGADIGGRGSRLYTHVDGDDRLWTIVPPAGEPVAITIHRKDANKY